MNYKLNYMCLKRGVSLILGHGVFTNNFGVFCVNVNDAFSQVQILIFHKVVETLFT